MRHVDVRADDNVRVECAKQVLRVDLPDEFQGCDDQSLVRAIPSQTGARRTDN